MIAKLGGGATGQAALDAALEAGEVHGVVGDNGQTFYMWQEYEITKKSGTRHSVSTSRSMALDHATLEGIAAILDGVQWGFNVVKAVEQEKSTGQIPDIVWDKLKHALTGMDKAVWCSLKKNGKTSEHTPSEYITKSLHAHISTVTGHLGGLVGLAENFEAPAGDRRHRGDRGSPQRTAGRHGPRDHIEERLGTPSRAGPANLIFRGLFCGCVVCFFIPRGFHAGLLGRRTTTGWQGGHS